MNRPSEDGTTTARIERALRNEHDFSDELLHCEMALRDSCDLVTGQLWQQLLVVVVAILIRGRIVPEANVKTRDAILLSMQSIARLHERDIAGPNPERKRQLAAATRLFLAYRLGTCQPTTRGQA